MLQKQHIVAVGAGALLAASAGVGMLAFAQTNDAIPSQAGTNSPMMHMPGVGGTVSAVNGNTITITGRNGQTYTVDASAATVTKEETVSVSNIAVGDTIGVMGTVTGNSVTATNIHDGQMPPMGAGVGWHHGPRPNDNDADDQGSTATQPTTTQ